jgi:hypothetical protein
MTKMTNIKYLILFMFLLVLSSIVLAVPPFQSSENMINEGTVIFPKIDYFPENTNFTLHFHFLNSSIEFSWWYNPS